MRCRRTADVFLRLRDKTAGTVVDLDAVSLEKGENSLPALGASRCGSDSLGSLKLGVGGLHKTGFVQAVDTPTISPKVNMKSISLSTTRLLPVLRSCSVTK